jgi:hypothetical protein
MARTQREKRMLVGLGVVVAVAVLMVGFTMIRSGGSDQDIVAPQAGATRPQAPVTEPSPEPSPETPAAPLVFRGVDPFRPLVGTKQDAPQAPPPPAELQPVPEGPASAVVGGNTVSLIDIFEKNGNKRAHVDVDGTVYAAGAGDNFVDDYVLVAFDDPCVQFAWRDQSFRLCVQPGTGG